MKTDALKGRYLRQLAKDYPNRYAIYTEIINLEAILNLPKGTEHFISDVHGEYCAFRHILNNVSGVIRDKVEFTFHHLPEIERRRLCTLIYYPEEMLNRMHNDGSYPDEEKLQKLIMALIQFAVFLSSKYTRPKVQRAIPKEYGFIINELMHSKADEDNNRASYHRNILKSVIKLGNADSFIISVCTMLKHLAIDRLHVLGDLFDRGAHPDKVMDLLVGYHNLDLQWGNHDLLWMGAACGSEVCAATAIRNNVRYGNLEMLENGYGISLRDLAMFAHKYYSDDPQTSAMEKAISIITLKLQGEIIMRNPEFNMRSRMLLLDIDYEHRQVKLQGRVYPVSFGSMPTIDPKDPYRLTQEERHVVDSLKAGFINSKRLQEHAEFLCREGSMYLCCNGNLLFHGCIPLNDDGTFARILCNGEYLYGRRYLDYCDQRVRMAFQSRKTADVDFMWYLWCGPKSPLSGRVIKTFERVMVADKSAWHEPRDPYYLHYYNEDVCNMILRDFNLDPYKGHIINGHTPIKVKDGESPIRANGRLLVIDGGFCRAYQKTTGIAGYTLIYNSHNLRLKAHKPFTSIEDVLENNADILSDTILVETFPQRRMVADMDDGETMKQKIEDLRDLLEAYQKGIIQEQNLTKD